ncbi:MAG: hypothetical protein MJ238_01180 [Bacilli bacterium]|nr:hypothetical protein [Bacilli bacterium]
MKMNKLALFAFPLFLVSCNNSPLDVESSNSSSISTESSHDRKSVVPSDSNVAVVYFSRTGNTKAIAGYISENYSCPAFEVEAKVPYSDDDIKYYTDCRADREQGDPNARPELKNTNLDLSIYDCIFLGYPIWHSDAPKIMYTFVETFDLSNKTIVPFCTSASSGIGNSAKNLENLTHQGTWLEGKRFSSNESRANVLSWVESLPINKKEAREMRINETKVDVRWEDNESVEELFSIARDGLRIDTHLYGGFEQVGSLGHTIKSNDVEMTTNPGDIVLYSSNQIVVFFGSNTWAYTKLGHINLEEAELNKLLNVQSTTIELNN